MFRVLGVWSLAGVIAYFLFARHAFRICLVPKPVKYEFDFVPQKSGHEGAVSNAVTTA
jgi:hypothetical protein